MCTRKFFLNGILLFKKINVKGIKAKFWNLTKYDIQRIIAIDIRVIFEYLFLFIKDIMKYEIIIVKRSNDNILKLNIEKQLKIKSEKIL